jgi:hypothetical protein
MSKKLTPEELEKLSNTREHYYDLRIHITDIVLTEERLKNDKQSTLINIDLAYNELVAVQDEIHAKYGSVKVNMQTGEVQ